MNHQILVKTGFLSRYEYSEQSKQNGFKIKTNIYNRIQKYLYYNSYSTAAIVDMYGLQYVLVGKRRFCVQVVLSGTSRFPFRLTHFVSFIFISFRLVSVHLFILDRFSFFPSKQITDGIPYLAFFEKTHPSHINFELDQKYASHLNLYSHLFSQ